MNALQRKKSDKEIYIKDIVTNNEIDKFKEIDEILGFDPENGEKRDSSFYSTKSKHEIPDSRLKAMPKIIKMQTELENSRKNKSNQFLQVGNPMKNNQEAPDGENIQKLNSMKIVKIKKTNEIFYNDKQRNIKSNLV